MATASGSSRARSDALARKAEPDPHAPEATPPWSPAGFHSAFSRPDGRPQAAFQPAHDHPNRGISLLLQVVYFYGATLVCFSGALDSLGEILTAWLAIGHERANKVARKRGLTMAWLGL